MQVTSSSICSVIDLKVCRLTSCFSMQGGDRLLVMTPGGGGFGNPDEAADDEMEDAGVLTAPLHVHIQLAMHTSDGRFA